MSELIGYAPVLAAVFAAPQFIPQLVKIWRTDDTAGVSFGWAGSTAVNNAAWFAYFAISGYLVALVPAACAALLSAMLAALLVRRGRPASRDSAMLGLWGVALAGSDLLGGRNGLGALLAVAFAVQVVPAIRAAYRTDRPTGISVTTWLLVLSELTCWLVYGLHTDDPRLIALGCTGVTASLLVLSRVCRVSPTVSLAAKQTD